MGRHTFEIELGAEKYTCRTTFEAIDAFESKANTNIITAWQSLGEGDYKFSHVATAIWAAINGERKLQGQKPLLWEVVGQRVQDHGFLKCLGYASSFFSNSMPEQKSELKEDDEAEKKSTE